MINTTEMATVATSSIISDTNKMEQASQEEQQEKKAAEAPGPERTKQVQEAVIEALQTIYDPEIPVNIYELGLIYETNVSPFGDVHILMTLTSPNCPAAASLPQEVQTKAAAVEGVKSVEFELTFDPPWSMEMMSEEAKLELGFM